MKSDLTPREAIETFVAAAYSGGDVDEIAALIAPDFVDHDGMPNQRPGREGVIERIKMLRDAFQDMRSHNQDVIVDGNLICHRFHAELTFAKPLPWLPVEPDGKRYAFTGIDIVRYADGMFQERWGTPQRWIGGAPWDGARNG